MNRQRTTDHSIDRWSAGGVVLRADANNDGKLSVALCHRRAESLWALPKGTPEDGESVPETAAREVTEETGLQVETGPAIDDTYYSFFRTAGQTLGDLPFEENSTVRIDKTVHWYLMKYIGGDTSDHDHEYDDVEWIEINEASQRLTHRNEARVLEKAVAFYEGRAGSDD
ncbi:MAG: NUDIX hydrolase [Chloroflexi bacterium]|jgi:8-oxo-dGTP pyrophosphatase MutT (NUDIX family)|nr:NUDIX hydrolase [Chloroflexota bacterium]